jgi:hypothetical protein
MTNLNDFDRALSDFIADGPNTAPEAPVIAALAHARTSPRRPDLLAALRPDVMAHSRRRPFVSRAGLVLAVVALLAASIGVAVVGSRLSDPSVVPPGPSTSPTPTASPSTSPAAGVFYREIPLIVAAGSPFTLKVSDTTGELIDALSGQPGDGVSVDLHTVRISADPTEPTALIATWTGGPCETGATMTVDELRHLITIVAQDCSGDSIALDRVVQLRFRGAVDASAWVGTISAGPVPTDPNPGQPTASAATAGPFQPIGSPSVTPVRVILDDGVGDETWVDVVDESGRLVSAVAGPSTPGNGLENVVATNDSPTTLRLSWPGRPCDTVHRLTIDATLMTLTIDLPQCRGDLVGVDRSMVLTFSEAVDAASLDTQMLAGRGGVDMPTWTTVAPDANGDRYDLKLSDPGYIVDSLEGYFDPERGATGAGPTGIVLDQLDAAQVRLVWLGPSCANAFRLVLDQPGDTWTIWSAPCATSTAVLRMVDIALRSPRAANSIKIEARVGEPRS